MGWKTLQAVRYRESPASGELSLPPVSRHRLVLTIRPAERLEVRYEGVRLDRPPAAGSINVIPAGSSVLWRREGSMDALFVNLEPSLVARVAAGVVRFRHKSASAATTLWFELARTSFPKVGFGS